MKRVLVTGASGFVGRNTLQPLIEKGFEVFATCRSPLKAFPGVRWVTCDLLDAQNRQKLVKSVKPDYLLHCAWYAQHGLFWTSPENIVWKEASIDLVRYFSECGGQRALLVGSCAEYDWSRSDNTPWKESDPCKPHTLYGQSKLEVLQALEHRDTPPSLSWAWARLFLMFGRGEPAQKLVASICQSLIDNKPVHCSSGEQVRDFLHIEDVGQALVQTLTSPAEGVINVASGTPVKIADVAFHLAHIAQKPHLIKLGTLPDRPDDPPYMVADVNRLHEAVGFIPTASLFQRLNQVFDDYQSS